MLDVKAMADAATKAMKDYVARALAPLLQRLEAIENRPSPKDGESVPVEQVERMVADAVAKAVAELPAREQQYITHREEIESIVADAAERAVAAMPAPDVEGLVAHAVGKAIAETPMLKDGASVLADEVDRMAVEAVTKAVANVPRPSDGAPGRDAAHIEILPAIDGAKVYPRGTFATHKGGLWRSFETTVGMKGWECIVDGVASVDVAGHGRSIFLTVAKASGAEQMHPVTLPVMIYRGVWKEGIYDQGDTVTCGGAVWHCDITTDARPGSGTAGWTLAAKSGERGASVYTIALRNGFKGTEAEFIASLKGKPGEPGKPGRDLTQLGFGGGKH